MPSPELLWQRYAACKGITTAQDHVVNQDYFDDGTGKAPRYYQTLAVNRVIEEIAKGRDRLLLVMATGTGKTYTAFQIIWRLWKAGAKKRILFLADRNILVDQTKTNDRSEEHTSELQSLMRISYAVFCLNKQTISKQQETQI